MTNNFFVDKNKLLQIFSESKLKKSIAGLKNESFQVSKNAINSMRSLGVSIDMIAEVVLACTAPEMSYANTLHKSKYFETFFYNVCRNTIRSSISIGALWLEKGVGGDCLTLNFELYNKLNKLDISSRISSETGKVVTLSPYEGTSRNYFITYPEYVHRFLIMEIGKQKYLLDASFREVSLFFESGYILKRLLEFNNIYKALSPGVESYVGSIGYNEFNNFTVFEIGQMSTIGILDNQSLVVNYSFTKDTIHSTILPMLNTLTPLGELIHSFIHARTGEIIHIAPSHITINKSQKKQLEGILYNLNRASILRE